MKIMMEHLSWESIKGCIGSFSRRIIITAIWGNNNDFSYFNMSTGAGSTNCHKFVNLWQPAKGRRKEERGGVLFGQEHFGLALGSETGITPKNKTK